MKLLRASKVRVPRREKKAVHVREQQLRKILDAFPAQLWTALNDGTVDFFNQRVMDHCGKPAEELLGWNWQTIIHPEDLPRYMNDRRAAIAAGRTLEREIRILRADGQYTWWLFRLIPLRDTKQRIVKWYAAAFDIEDRKRAEEAGLEQRVLERTRIARELHDTLLQSFHASLLQFQSVSEMLEPCEVKTRLDRAIDLAARAVAEGRDAIQDLRSSPVETNDLVASVRSLGERLTASRVTPHSSVFNLQATGMPVRLRPSIHSEVLRISSEALHNAFRHARAQNIQVEITYHSEGLRLLVMDDGRGIARNILNKGGRKGHFGLSGMRERAKLIGGKLKLQSEKDSGTRLELSIPAVHAYSLPDDSR